MVTAAAPPTEAFAEAAERIASRLASAAIVADGECVWFGDEISPADGQWSVIHRTCGPDVYDGTAGIAWFLAHVAAQRHHAAAADVAMLAVETSLTKVPQLLAAGNVGLYSGAAGIGATAVGVGALLDEPQLRRRGVETILEAAEVLRAAPSWTSLDLIGGPAGVIVALVDLQETDALELAAALAGRLSSHGTTTPWGTSWPMDTLGSTPVDLCGLGHGASGFGWPLLELGVALGDTALVEAADMAFRYETAWLDPALGVWPDLREAQSGTTPQAGPYWCHGGGGIGLARLRAYELRRRDVDAAEAATAVRAAFASSRRALGDAAWPASNVSVCHGIGSTIDLLLSAHAILGPEEHLVTARRFGARMLDLVGNDVADLPAGILMGGRSPGLMLGDAGVGMLLLRLAEPIAVPSVGLFPVR